MPPVCARVHRPRGNVLIHVVLRLTHLANWVISTPLPFLDSHCEGVTEDCQVTIHGGICTSLGQRVTISNDDSWGDIGKEGVSELGLPPAQLAFLVRHSRRAFLGQHFSDIALNKSSECVPFG